MSAIYVVVRRADESSKDVTGRFRSVFQVRGERDGTMAEKSRCARRETWEMRKRRERERDDDKWARGRRERKKQGRAGRLNKSGGNTTLPSVVQQRREMEGDTTGTALPTVAATLFFTGKAPLGKRSQSKRA